MPLSDTPTPARPVKKSANSIGRWFQSGDPMIWICAGALALALIMVIGLLLLIGVRGLGHFWPKPIIQTTIIDPTGNERVVLGEHHGSERVTASIVRGGGYQLPDDMEVVLRQKFKVGNADFFNKKDFVWTVAE
ncbi:MAG: phosphate ABC transporter, permease protein PstA, partial [Verrucomicrobiales bacterium]